MEDAAETTTAPEAAAEEEEVWIEYTWIEEMLPSTLIAVFLLCGCAAVLAGLF